MLKCWDQGKRVRGQQRSFGRSSISVSVQVLVYTFLSLAIPLCVSAAVFQIPTGDVPGLIAAIHAANANGDENTITLEAGSYTLTAVDNTTNGPNGLPVVTSPLTIRGGGADTTILERDRSAPLFRLLRVAATGALVLEGLTIQHGYVNVGGGGLANSGTVTIRQATFAGNWAERGGGLVNGGTVTIIQSTFVDSDVTFEGGGLFNVGGTVTIAQSTFTSNIAEVGAGLLNQDGTVTITQSVFAGNGAFCCGGGIFTSGGTMVITDSTIANNGGGVVFGGSGISSFGTTLTITNSTIAHNEVFSPRFSNGGGILTDGNVVLQNTILALNTVFDGCPACGSIAPEAPDCAGSVTSLGHNLIGDPTGCTIDLQASDLTGDPDLGDFVDPGAPGQGQFPLLPGSPAIDAGNAAACPPTDQLDTLRRGPCDIGAIEFYPLVNDLVELGNVTTAFDSTPVLGGPAGTFRIAAAFTNTTPQPIEHLFAAVVELTGGNLLLNADGGPGGSGGSADTSGKCQHALRLRHHEDIGICHWTADLGTLHVHD
jgi:hypothetical protein